jgi:hypothetical protein
MSLKRDRCDVMTPDSLDFSERLRKAFADVTAADLNTSDKARWHQRLIAVTNAAKRDIHRARESLDRFDDDWKRQQSS